MGDILHLEQISKHFGFRTALKDVSIRIRGGDCVALLGPNGAGKTTLLKLIVGLETVSTGTIHWPEGVIHRRQIGFVAHSTYLYEDLSAQQNLLFYSRLYGISDPHDRIARALRFVDLEDRADDIIRTFSQGMKKRVTIARALLPEPELLLLDEPFAGLDPNGTERLGEYFRQLKESGRTIVLATNTPHALKDLADRVIVLSRGQVCFDGLRQELGEPITEAYLDLTENGSTGRTPPPMLSPRKE